MAEYSYPLSGTRTERIDFIRYLKRSGDQKGALRFWLLNPKGISKQTFTEI
jgi:hypothetical protein